MCAVKERELLERAGKHFRIKSAALLRRVTELGRRFGSPWLKMKSLATLAAGLLKHALRKVLPCSEKFPAA